MESQALLNKRGCLQFQKSQMGDTDTEVVHTHWADSLFRWKMKNSQKISHMTDRPKPSNIKTTLVSFTWQLIQVLKAVICEQKNYIFRHVQTQSDDTRAPA